MTRTSPSTVGPDDAFGLFPIDAAWARTQVLDAEAVGAGEFDLDEFGRYRRIRILTYSSSTQMLSTVLERFEEASVECVLGYSRVVNDMAAIIALQTAAMEDVRSALLGLSSKRRDEILKRVQDGRLRVRVVEGHVSHAKIFLLSEGPDGDRCVLTGSANFSTSALLGDQHEVLIRFRDDRAWEHFEGQYLEVRDHASAEVSIASLAEDRVDPAEEVPPEAAPVLAPGRGAQVVQLAQPAESGDSVERGRRVEKLYDVVLPALPKETRGTGKATLKIDGTIRKRFSGLIRRQTRQLDPTHPTFSLDPASREATVCGSPWPLDSAEDRVREDAASLVAFWDAYCTAFRGRVEKLQRDYFVFLCWMFFSPLMCTLRRRAALDGRDVIRFPRVGIVYGKSNSGKTQLVEIVGRFMLGDDFQGAIRSRLTAQTLRGIDASYRRMPAFFDDVGWRRFREHAPEFIKDETLTPHDEAPCTIMSMNARMGGFPDEVAKRCLLIYSSASLPSEDEGGRIAMSDRLSSIEPSTHLYAPSTGCSPAITISRCRATGSGTLTRQPRRAGNGSGDDAAPDRDRHHRVSAVRRGKAAADSCSGAAAPHGDGGDEDWTTMTMRRCSSRSHDGPPVGAPRSSLRPDGAVHRRTTHSSGCPDAKSTAEPNLAVVSPLLRSTGCVFPA